MHDKTPQPGQSANTVGKALVVEDNPEYANLIRIVLESLGYKFQHAVSVVGARRLLREYTPDLVLLDGHLPDGNGLELCADIRGEARLARAMVIVLSAKKTYWQGQEWLRAGADQCWPKIFNVDRLSASIKGMLRRREWDTKVIKPTIPGVLLDLEGRKVVFQGTPSQKLADRELAFMNLLFNTYPDTLSRAAIQDKIFALSRAEQFDLALNELVRRLRKKLPSSLSDRIEAVYGHGYRLSLLAGVSAAVRTSSN